MEEFKMKGINNAITHLEEGKARFGVMLKA